MAGTPRNAKQHRCIQLHASDNVCVAIDVISAGSIVEVSGQRIEVRSKIPAGHKLALCDVESGGKIRKFGQPIGFASRQISLGDWVHVHNVAATKAGISYDFCTEVHNLPAATAPLTFNGFRRPNGSAGTRNYVGIVSTVNCSATTAKYVAAELSKTCLNEYPNIDGIVAFVHKSGCALEFGGEDHEQLNRTLAGFASHPNLAACLILGLGCETAQAGYLQESQQLVQLGGVTEIDNRMPVMTIQESGGIRKTVKKATEILKTLLPQANAVQRVPIPLSELKVAMECGGSDANSGITANPAVGIASDLLVSYGATSILSETTEIYGAEHLLTARAESREIGEKLLERIRWWEQYAAQHNASIDNNPSVGNKNGGLTTIFEKSLGAIAKAGTTPLRGVYRYAEPIDQSGFVIMDSPGFDPASVTGKIASGAQMVVFTTGRGSCFGCKPSPTIKVATNSAMYARMEEDMDINAGVILEGESVQDVGRRIFEQIVATASGKLTKSEVQGVGDEEFCPWFPGPIF